PPAPDEALELLWADEALELLWPDEALEVLWPDEALEALWPDEALEPPPPPLPPTLTPCMHALELMAAAAESAPTRARSKKNEDRFIRHRSFGWVFMAWAAPRPAFYDRPRRFRRRCRG